MIPSRRSSVWSALAVWALVTAAAAPMRAQQRQPGVSLGLQYRAGQKTTLLVLPVSGPAGDSIGTILARDLDFSDRFTVIPPSAAPTVVTRPLNFAQLAKLEAQGVVQAELLTSGSLRVRLFDVGTKAQVQERDFPLPATANTPAWRQAVHGVSDQVEAWITGQRGIAQTRIAFVKDQRIWTIDSDGAALTPLNTQGMSPQWTPNGRSVVYSVLENTNGVIRVVDVATGRTRTLTNAPGVVDGMPTVAPDGRTVVFARNGEGGTDLYRVPIDGGAPTRISVGRGSSNLSPSFSPEGDRLVFTSDRTGHPDVYISDADGTNAMLLTTGSYGDRQFRAEAEWSPDGRWVAYQSLNGEVFQVMLVNVRDLTTRIVTSEGRNDSPSWAPDSRHLVVTSTRSGIAQLWVIDIETGRARQLKVPGAARLPSWSRRLTP